MSETYDTIKKIAEVAQAVGCQANVGASETAGTIISILYANPHLVDRFMEEGASLFIDGPIMLSAANGALTFYAQTGEILTPTELVRRTQGKEAIQ